MNRQEILQKALYDIKIETPTGDLLNVKDISYEDAWDHCQLMIVDYPNDGLLQKYLGYCLREGFFGITGSGGNGYSVYISAHSKFIKDPIGDRYTCQRRKENDMHIDDGPFVGSGTNLDYWNLIGEDLCCSYCGSLHPMRVLELVRKHGCEIIERTNKNHKWYLRRDEIINAGFGGIKYYRQHDNKDFVTEIDNLFKLQKSDENSERSSE